jgi:hypothetical protein
MPGNPLTDPNWAPNLASTVDKYVGMVRDRATLKVVVLVRALVFGLIIAVTAVVAVVLLVILGVGLLERVVSLIANKGSAVWISYLVIGGIFLLAGALIMRLRAPKEEPAK